MSVLPVTGANEVGQAANDLASSALHWWDARDYVAGDTITSRNSANLLTLPVGSERPTIDSVNGYLEFDGVDDYASFDYTPSYTAAAGELTVLWVGEVASDYVTFARLVSFESVNSNGLYVRMAEAAPPFRAGAVSGDGSVTRLSSIADFTAADTLTWVASTIANDGSSDLTCRAAPDMMGNTISISHDPVFSSGELGREPSTGRKASMKVRAVLIWETALTEQETQIVGNGFVSGAV